jgi:microcompartment protein CcmL/EutN
MESDAVLTERKASTVIRDAGYEVVSFERGEPPKQTAYLFRVSPFEPDGRASLESGLREDLEGADKVALDSLGRGTVIVSGDAAAVQDAVSASLRKRGQAAESFESRIWPRLDATYVVAVSRMNDAVETRTVADALAGVAKVVAVHVYQDTGTATLWLKEPCDALEANVRAALATGGFTVSRFELKAD